MFTQVAFSEFWGFLGGFLCAVEGVCNLAVFPTVTLDYLLELSGFRHLDSTQPVPLLTLSLRARLLALRSPCLQ